MSDPVQIGGVAVTQQFVPTPPVISAKTATTNTASALALPTPAVPVPPVAKLTESQKARNGLARFKAHNIPLEFRDHARWALASTKKTPMKISTMLMQQRLEGAKINEPPTLGLFEDMRKAMSMPHVTSGNGEIMAAGFAMLASLGVVCIDLDFPDNKIDEQARQGKLSLDDADKNKKTAHRVINSTVHEFYKEGAYVERSVSGRGYHIFFRAESPHPLYSLGTFGNVYTDNQFIYLTGDKIIAPSDDPATWTTNEARGLAPLPQVGGLFKNWIDAYTDAGVLKKLSKAEKAGSLSEDCFDYCRMDCWSDEIILWQLEHSSTHDWSAYNGGKGFTGDWSEDTRNLIGAFDKLTASGAQIERLIFNSPRLLNAGPSVGGEDRYERLTRTFARDLATCRESNNRTVLSKGKGLNFLNIAPLMFAEGQKLKQNEEHILSCIHTKFNSEDHRVVSKEEVEDEHNEIMDSIAAAQQDDGEDGIEAGQVVDYEINQDPLYGQQPIKGLPLRAYNILCDGVPDQYKTTNCMPTGMLGRLMHYTYKGMPEPRMDLAQLATLATISGIIGRRHKAHNGSGINIPTLSVATTGLGKTQAINSISGLIQAVSSPSDAYPYRQPFHTRDRLPNMLASSSQGMHNVFMDTPSMCWFADEVKSLTKSIFAPSDKVKSEIDIQASVNKLFDCAKANTLFEPIASVSSSRRGDKSIRNLNVSTYFTTTIDAVKEFFDKGTVASGAPSRFLFLVALGESGALQDDDDVLTEIPSDWDAGLMKSLLCDADSIDSEMAASDQRTDFRRATYRTPMSYEAKQFYVQQRKRANLWKRNHQSSRTRFPDHYKMLYRAYDLVLRVATVAAVLDSVPLSFQYTDSATGEIVNVEETPSIVELRHMYWATAYVSNILCRLLLALDLGIMGADLGEQDRVAMRMLLRLTDKDANKRYLIEEHVVNYGYFNNRLKEVQPFCNAGKESRSGDPRDAVFKAMRGLVDDGVVEIVTFEKESNGRTRKSKGYRKLQHPLWAKL